MNRFIFIIPFRNVKQYIKICCQSLISQNNQNWKAILCDDVSDDDTLSEIPQDSRFTIRTNSERITALPNIHYAITESNLNDEDIICILDGDDFLLRNDSIDIIDKLYQDDALLSYGQYAWPNGYPGHCIEYNETSFSNLRKGGYWASHLRTFKYKLYKQLIIQDPNVDCYKDNNGEFYKTCYDIAIMTPLMEIAGLNRIKFNPIPIYYYRLHPNNDHSLHGVLQKTTEKELFAKQPFNRADV
jgi:glycosyltransferase involved in cell wall biosynthesis